MDTLLEMVQENDLKPDEVREIRLRAGSNILEPLRYEQPRTELQAKFSLQFGLSSILLRRRAGLREFNTEFVNSPGVRETMMKVRTMLDPEIEKMGADRMRSIVEVELNSGITYSRFADTARGTPEKPLKETELEEKFRDCAEMAVYSGDIKELLNSIRHIEELTSVKRLMESLGK